jgi:hypothetical protein
MDSLLISNILKALSDAKSLALFNVVTFTLSLNTHVAMTRLGITQRQYYSRMNQLINAGLVTRKSGKYFLTSLGRVVHECLVQIGHAIKDYWKLKIIDSIEMMSTQYSISAEERWKMIDTLIENNYIKNIVFNYNLLSNERGTKRGAHK